MKHIQKLVTRYLQYFLGDQFMEQYKPPWSVIERDSVDMYYPEFNLGVKIDEYDASDISRRMLSYDKEHRLKIKGPQELLKEQVTDWLSLVTEKSFNVEGLPYSLGQKIKRYRREDQIVSRRIRGSIQRNKARLVQLDETKRIEEQEKHRNKHRI